MTMKRKLLLTMVLLVAVPMLVSVMAGNWFAKGNSSQLLTGQAEKKLISMREFRKRGVEEFFVDIRRQITAMAQADAVVEATTRFNNSYFDFTLEAGISGKMDKLRDGLNQYYQNQFSAAYKTANPDSTLATQPLFDSLSENSMALQALYISENKFPLGEKEKLKSGGDLSNYTIFHQRYHSQFLYALQSNGYNDIFIAHPETGEIIYSVFKEVDFATSLKDGPYAESGIGDAYRAALKADTPEFTYLTDFNYYTPSYEAPASFISAPIFKLGEIIGVLIFQVPIHKLNAILTSSNRWKEDGLGESGEVYLVGPDNLMRSDSRFLIESPDNYLASAAGFGIDEANALKMKTKNTSILLQAVNTPGVESALTGQVGFDTFPDYRNIPVLSAYAKLDVPGLDWAIVSQMDAEEAFAPAQRLSKTLFASSAGVAAVMLAVAVALGGWFTRRLTKPIERLEQEIVRMEAESDLSQRLNSDRGDVTGGIVASLNNMLEKMYSIITMVSSSSVSMTDASSNMNEISNITAHDVIKQKNETDQVVVAIEKLNETASVVSSNADDASNAAREANKHAKQGNEVVAQATDSISQLAGDVQSASDVIARLANESENIGGVLDVIRGIAEQTNLLALNAAIEAARAGEQGRGFAVVADEVRTLASRTGESTEEIQKMIEGLQTGAQDAVAVMERGQQQVTISVEKTNDAAEVLKSIISAMSEITDMNERIAEASSGQCSLTDQVTQNMSSIAKISDGTTANAQQTEQASVGLNQLAKDLNAAVAQFKL